MKKYLFIISYMNLEVKLVDYLKKLLDKFSYFLTPLQPLAHEFRKIAWMIKNPSQVMEQGVKCSYYSTIGVGILPFI